MGLELFGPERIVERLGDWNEQVKGGLYPASAYIVVGSNKNRDKRMIEVKPETVFEDKGRYYKVKALLRARERWSPRNSVVVTERVYKVDGELEPHNWRPSYLSARYGKNVDRW